MGRLQYVEEGHCGEASMHSILKLLKATNPESVKGLQRPAIQRRRHGDQSDGYGFDSNEAWRLKKGEGSDCETTRLVSRRWQTPS